MSGMKPLSTVMGLVEKGGRILFLKRRKHPFKGCWALAGGKIEAGEHPDEAVLREIKEETGFTCEIRELLGNMSEHVFENGSMLWHFNIFLFRLSPGERGEIETDEGELRWFTPEEIESEKESITPSDFLVIKELLKNGKRGHFKSVIEKSGQKYTQKSFERY